MSDVKQNCPACRGAGVFVKTVMVDFGHGERVEDRCNRCLGTGIIYAPLPASTAASEQQAGADERAQRLIRELGRISMTLAADLVQGAAYTFEGHDYLDRDSVMARVVRWRTEWDATAPDRTALTHRATTELQPIEALGWRANTTTPDIATTADQQGAAQAQAGGVASELLAEIARALDLVADAKLPTKTCVQVTNTLHHCNDAISGRGYYGAAMAAPATSKEAMSDHDPINELVDVVDLFSAGAGRKQREESVGVASQDNLAGYLTARAERDNGSLARWVKVEHLLPKDRQHVIVSHTTRYTDGTQHTSIMAAIYDSGNWISGDGNALYRPTHWHPFPDLPKDET